MEEARQSLRARVIPRSSMTQTPMPQPMGKHEEGALQLTDVLCNARISSSNPSANVVLPEQPHPRPSPATAVPVVEPLKTIEASGNKAQLLGLAASLKRRFQATVKALFKRTPAPQPQARRRRTGETVGTFRMVARDLLRPIIRLPPISRTMGFLIETLPWLHLWEWNEINDHDFTSETKNGDDNHLSPHP